MAVVHSPPAPASAFAAASQRRGLQRRHRRLPGRFCDDVMGL